MLEPTGQNPEFDPDDPNSYRLPTSLWEGDWEIPDFLPEEVGPQSIDTRRPPIHVPFNPHAYVAPHMSKEQCVVKAVDCILTHWDTPPDPDDPDSHQRTLERCMTTPCYSFIVNGP